MKKRSSKMTTATRVLSLVAILGTMSFLSACGTDISGNYRGTQTLRQVSNQFGGSTGGDNLSQGIPYNQTGTVTLSINENDEIVTGEYDGSPYRGSIIEGRFNDETMDLRIQIHNFNPSLQQNFFGNNANQNIGNLGNAQCFIEISGTLNVIDDRILTGELSGTSNQSSGFCQPATLSVLFSNLRKEGEE